MMCRKRIDDVETGEKSLTRDKSGGRPDCCPDDIRHEGGVKLSWALARNVETCAPMRREKSRWEVPISDAAASAGIWRRKPPEPTWPLAARERPRAHHRATNRLLHLTRLGLRRSAATCIICRTAGYGPVCPGGVGGAEP